MNPDESEKLEITDLCSIEPYCQYVTETGNRIWLYENGSYYTISPNGFMIPGRELRTYDEFCQVLKDHNKVCKSY